MSQKTAIKNVLLVLTLIASILAILAASAASPFERQKSSSKTTTSSTVARGTEPLQRRPCGSTTEGGPEGPAMQREDVCTGYAMTAGPVTEPAVQDPDRYAWRTFCELNQPAPGKGRLRIWQTWANQFDLFVSRPDPKHPPTWAGATSEARPDAAESGATGHAAERKQ
ncbi:MAG TPA: hypothetical protein VNN08_19530 [Thermoanaerobaculia bacterium]|nr:hypothetical protein [Thermoanaerobaculia bacterium]